MCISSLFLQTGADSHCEDKELSEFATQTVDTSDIWYKGEIFASFVACENMDGEPSKTY